MRKPAWIFVALLALAAPVLAQSAQPAPVNAVRAGELVTDPPTLINLGFEWVISGDNNRNARVEVSYRRKGEAAWKRGMDLLRLQGERVWQTDGVFNVRMPNMFAGSVLDLEENTAYEVRLALRDPDGGSVTRIVNAATRAVPMPAKDGKVYHVYARDWKGPREPGFFNDLMCAYNYYCGGGDTVTGSRPRVKPGDTILVHAGTYRYRPEMYTGDRAINATTPIEGTYYFYADGTRERPIVINGAGDGDVIFDGNGNFNLFNVKAADYHYFEGLTFRNTEIAIWAGTQFIAGSKGLTVKRSRFENVNMGIATNYAGSSEFTILDNVFIGRDDPTFLQGWAGAFWAQFAGIKGQKFPPTLDSYAGVRLYGAGHVVAYNHFANWHDGIAVETYGNPDGNTPEATAIAGPFYTPRKDWHLRPVAMDFYNNYMTNFHDNAIEIDGSMHNIRVMRNMMLNSASHPFCNQPAIGGPVYWIRNIAYHAPGGSTRMTNGAAGAMFLNNTILAETNAGSSANIHWRNNLMLGSNALPTLLAVTTYTNYSSSDYNGFGAYPGATANFVWNSPAPGVTADYHDLLAGNAGSRTLQQRSFATLAQYSAATGQDSHSVLVDYDIFEKVPRLNSKDLARVQEVYKGEDLDFRLKQGAAAVDKGIAIPNVTDGFTGAAPDLGALERGQPLPHYGPRP